MNAIYVTYSLAMLLTLINLGSAVALNIITSLGTGALTCSYIVSISCIIRKRLVGEPLLPRPWSLGKWGLPINVIGVCFLILCFVMNFFPQSPKNLDATTFNWNIMIVSLFPLLIISNNGDLIADLPKFVSAVIIAGINYAVTGRKKYEGPVAYIRKDL
jgi:choline transport protein